MTLLIKIARMKIVTGLFLIGLLGLALSYGGESPLAQKPEMVTLRLGLTSSPPGLPGVKVSVDRNPVPVGAQVRFVLSPAAMVLDPRFRITFFFGDGKRQLLRQANVAHVYAQPGTYTYSVVVEEVKQEPVDISEPPPQVNASVNLTANANSIEAGKPVTFTARVSPQSSKARYRFVFGDQMPATEWQTGARTTHRFKSAGKYSVRVEARVPNAPKTVSGSVTVEITELAGKATLDLKISPPAVPWGLPVVFQAIASAAPANANYRFNFGDGSASSWSPDPIQAHTYRAAGNYPAFVEMAPASQGTREPLVSGRQRVRVTPVVPIPNPNNNRNANTGGNANSNNTPKSNTNEGANSNRDANVGTSTNANSKPGSGNTNSNANAPVNANNSHNANSGVNANTTANANRGGNDANANAGSANAANANGLNAGQQASPKASETSAATGTNNRSDLWKYLIIIAVVLFIAYQIVSYLLAPRPTFVPHFDPGDSRVDAGKPFLIDLQMDVDSNLRAGEFRVDTAGGSLIKSRRTEP